MGAYYVRFYHSEGCGSGWMNELNTKDLSQSSKRAKEIASRFGYCDWDIDIGYKDNNLSNMEIAASRKKGIWTAFQINNN